LALEILRLAKEKSTNSYSQLMVAANAFSNDAETKIVDVSEIPDGWQVWMQDQNHWQTSKKVMESKRYFGTVR
jgi:phosphoglycerate kinase